MSGILLIFAIEFSNTIIMKTIQDLRAEDVPRSWLICHNDQCPMKEECLRYAVAPIVEASREYGPSVYHSALKDGKCSYFVDKEPERLAWGFRPLFSKVRHEDYANLRCRVMALFGSESQFFRYNRGRFRLSPEQQDQVLALFRSYGYDTKDLRFAHYDDCFKFNT